MTTPVHPTTTFLRTHYNMSRRDAVRCQATTHGDVSAYKGTTEYQERAKRRAKQGNGLTGKGGAVGITFRNDQKH